MDGIVITAFLLLGLLLLVSLVPAAVAAVVYRRAFDPGRCVCGYLLSGLPVQGCCPECGIPLVHGVASLAATPPVGAHLVALTCALPPAVALALIAPIALLGAPHMHPAVFISAAVLPVAVHSAVLGAAARRARAFVFVLIVLATPAVPMALMSLLLRNYWAEPVSEVYLSPLTDFVAGVGAYCVAALPLSVAALLPLRAAGSRRRRAAAARRRA